MHWKNLAAFLAASISPFPHPSVTTKNFSWELKSSCWRAIARHLTKWFISMLLLHSPWGFFLNSIQMLCPSFRDLDHFLEQMSQVFPHLTIGYISDLMLWWQEWLRLEYIYGSCPYNSFFLCPYSSIKNIHIATRMYPFHIWLVSSLSLKYHSSFIVKYHWV